MCRKGDFFGVNVIVRVVIESIILAFIVLPMLFFFIVRIKADVEVDYAMYHLSTFGYTIGFNGPVRMGKSTLANACTYNLEKKLQSECYSMMNDIVNNLYFINFVHFEYYLSCHFNDDTCQLDVIPIVNEYIKMIDVPDGLMNDFINNVRVYDLIYRFADNFRILYYRKNFVCSKTYYYSNLTQSSAKLLKDVTTKIKEIDTSHEYYIERYLVLLEDEVSVDNSNNKSSSKEDKLNGRKEFKILFGQIFEETCYYINVKQVAIDEKADERRLLQSNCEIIKRKESATGVELIAVVNFFESFCLFKMKLNFFFKKRIGFRRKYRCFDDYYKSVSKLRLKTRKYKTMRNFIKAQSNIRSYVRVYRKADDVGKVDEKYFDSIVLVNPLKFSYVGKTHEYCTVQEECLSNSRVSFSDIPNTKFIVTKGQKDVQLAFLHTVNTKVITDEVKAELVNVINDF